MQRIVWIVSRESTFTALVYPWALESDGTVWWCGEKCLWMPFT